MNRLITLFISSLMLMAALAPESLAQIWRQKNMPFDEMNTVSICQFLGRREAPSDKTLDDVRARLKKENILTNKEWQAVEKRKPDVGMSKCAVWASWGDEYLDVLTLRKPGKPIIPPRIRYACKDFDASVLPYCPTTEVWFEGEKILDIKPGPQ